MNREAIIDQLSQDIISYVMAGSFEEHQVAREIKLKISTNGSRTTDYYLICTSF